MRKTVGIIAVMLLIISCSLTNGCEFKGSIEGEPDMSTYSESVDGILQNGFLDSLYLIEIVRELNQGEYTKLKGYDELFLPTATFYECRLIYDYLREQEINEIKPYYQFGSQAEPDLSYTPYMPGETFVTFISIPLYKSDIIHSVIASFEAREPLPLTDDHYVYGITRKFDELQTISTEMTQQEKIKERENMKRRVYMQKFRFGDLLEFIKNDLEERGFITKE